MSVLVKGMKMPINCDYCRFLSNYDILRGVCKAADRIVTSRETGCWRSKPDWCPLVDVPDEHGCDGDSCPIDI